MTAENQKEGCLAHAQRFPAGAGLQYDYYRPRSWDELSALLESEPLALILAGGTDVMIRVRKRLTCPKALVSLRGVAELRGIEVTGGRIRIGAATPIADIVHHAEVRARASVLVQALQRLGSEQIRNVATLGGNLGNASPCADSAPALLVLGATLRIRRGGAAREIPVASFFVGPGRTCLERGELITDVFIDPVPGARGAYLKKSRVFMDLAQASVAVLVHAEQDTCRRVHIAAGAVAPIPLRLREVENLLEGQRVTQDLLRTAQEVASRSISPISDVRASADYRRVIVGVYVKRALQGIFDSSKRSS